MAEGARTHRLLAVLAGALGTFALAAGEPYPGGRAPAARASDIPFVMAVDVARSIRSGRSGLRVLDLRPESLFDEYHIPGAQRVSVDELRRRAWRRDEEVVLYAGDDAEAARAAVILSRQGVARPRVLRGGVLAWVEEIAEPRLVPLSATATPQQQAARREQLELSRYFGGVPVVSPAATPARAAPSRRSEAAAVARTLRRGC